MPKNILNHYIDPMSTKVPAGILKAAYGYRVNPTKKGVHVIDEEAVKIVRWLFQSFADGMSVGSCARELTGDISIRRRDRT